MKGSQVSKDKKGQIFNKHIEKFSSLLIIKEMYIKTIIKYHSAYIKLE